MYMTHLMLAPSACRVARRALLAALPALLCSALAAAQPLRLAVARAPLALPMLLAQEKGFFAAEGVQVSVQHCVGGYRCLRLLLDGKADVATTGDLPVVFNSFERSDFAILATIGSTMGDTKLLVRRDAGVASPQQLVGKRVGLVPGTASHYVFELSMMAAGADPKGVVPVPLAPEDMAAALQSGQVDAVAIWEPIAYQATQQLAGQVQPLAQDSHYVQTFMLVASRRVTGRRDAELAAVLRAVERAQRHIAEQPEQARQLLAHQLQLDRKFVSWVWPELTFRLALDPALLRTMEGEARWAEREGHVRGRRPANFMSFVHREPLLQAKPGAVGIGR